MIGIGLSVMNAGILGGDAQSGLGPSFKSVATSYLAGYEPLYFFDFQANRVLANGADFGTIEDCPGISVVRASTGNYVSNDGSLTAAPANTFRLGDRGLLVEPTRTNLFLQSGTPATQSITVTAVPHALTFYGTGTITLSGASTAGPLVGTGASDRVTLIFTPTAGSLTLTISGSITMPQLEAGPCATSYVATAGASVQRAADIVNVDLTHASLTGSVDFPVTLWAEFERTGDQGAIERILRLWTTGAGGAERSGLHLDASDLLTGEVVAGNSVQATVALGAVSVGSVHKAAIRIAANSANIALNGTSGTEDTTVTVPATPTNLQFGHQNTTGVFCGYLRKVGVYAAGQANAVLEAITS